MRWRHGRMPTGIRSPRSLRLQKRCSAMITWSSTLMPISSPALTMRIVSPTSSPEGAGSPDGWLWNSTSAAEIVGSGAREPVQPPGDVEHGVRQLERAGPRPAVPEDNRQQLVVAEAGRADPLEFFTRPVVRRDDLHDSSCCYTSASCPA